MADLIKESSDGRRADEILNDPLVRMALDGMKANLLTSFSSQRDYNQEKSNQVWLAIKVIDKFEAALRETINTGKMADIEIERQSWLKQQRQKLKRR
jgi:hypothetical protein